MIDLDKIDEHLNTKKHIGILILRIFIGARLFYGVVDNVISWQHMMEFSQFMQNYNFPFPTVSAIVSVYAQFLGSIMILIGYKIRLASLVLVINFLVALIFVHITGGDSIEGMTPAMAMLFGCLTLVFTGADKLSIDERNKS